MKVLGGYNMKTYLVGGLTFHGEEVKGGGGGVERNSLPVGNFGVGRIFPDGGG